MHPTVAHVVPLNPSSMSTVEAPAPRATRSADNPAVPAPMIATSPLFMRTGARNPRSWAGREKVLNFQEFGAAGGIRTPDPNVRSVVLYPTELRPRTRAPHIRGAAIKPQRISPTRNPLTPC